MLLPAAHCPSYGRIEAARERSRSSTPQRPARFLPSAPALSATRSRFGARPDLATAWSRVGHVRDSLRTRSAMSSGWRTRRSCRPATDTSRQRSLLTPGRRPRLPTVSATSPRSPISPSCWPSARCWLPPRMGSRRSASLPGKTSQGLGRSSTALSERMSERSGGVDVGGRGGAGCTHRLPWPRGA
jgi:hypothetical protein